MRWAMFKAAGLFLFAPVLTGTFLGYMLKVLNQGTENQSIFMSKMVLDVLPMGPVFAAVGLTQQKSKKFHRITEPIDLYYYFQY